MESGRPAKTIRLDGICPEAWTQLSKKQRENTIVEWAEESAKLQAAHGNRGIFEALPNDKVYITVIADARLKLEKDTAPA